MNTKLLHNSFNAGEISPELYSRPDTQQFRFGAAKMLNWFPKESGAAQLRPGFGTVASLTSKARAVPFKVDGDDYIITIQAGIFRFFRNGLPVSVQGGVNDVYVVGDQAASQNVDLVNDVVYTTRPHGFADLEEVRVTSVGGTGEPGGLSSTFTYEARPQGPYGLQFKFGATDPVDITSLNTGALYVWREAGLPDDYEVPVALVAVAPALGGHRIGGAQSFSQITLAGPVDWPAGTRWKWEVGGGGTAPSTPTDYGYVFVTSTHVAYDGREFAITSSDPATANPPVAPGVNDILAQQIPQGQWNSFACTGTNAFTGPVRAARIYPKGTVLFLRGAAGAFAANTFIRAKVDVPSATTGPQTAEWETVPAPWLELPNNYTESELNEITFAQTTGKIRFAHRNHPVVELVQDAQGKWSQRNPLDVSRAPIDPVVTPERGARLGITTSNPAGNLIVTNADHGLGAGDLLYISGNASIPDDFYLCGATGTNTITQLMTFAGATFAPSGATAGGTIVVVESTAKANHRYVVTAVDANGREFARSAPSDPVFNLLANAEAYNSISWTTDTEAAAYRIYKEEDGTELFGFIAEAGAPPFLDRNVSPDFGTLAPELDEELNSDYPGAVAFYDQRGVFGGNKAKPQGLWLSSLGRDNELVTRRTQLDTDRIALEIASREGQSVRHIVPVSELLVLTNTAEWALYTQNTDSLTPTSASIRLQTTVGASYVRPLVLNNSVLFASEGNHVYRLGFQLTENSFKGPNLSLRAAHLFNDIALLDSTSTKSRVSAGWFSDSEGRILGLTYSEEEQVAGWHQHRLDDYRVVSVAAAREGDEDRIHAVVEREGAYTLVRLQSVNIKDAMGSAHLDMCFTRNTRGESPASLTVTGSNRVGAQVTATASTFAFDFDAVGGVLFFDGGFAAEITERVSRTVVKAKVIATGLGLPAAGTAWGVAPREQRGRTLLGTNHGQVTALLQPVQGDAEVRTVNVSPAGVVSLPFPCRAFHLGVPYSNHLRTMPVSAQMEAAGMGRVKAISHVYIRVYETAGLTAGPDLGALRDVFAAGPTLRTEERRELTDQSWTRDGQMSFVQPNPLPATVAGVTLDVSFGG